MRAVLLRSTSAREKIAAKDPRDFPAQVEKVRYQCLLDDFEKCGCGSEVRNWIQGLLVFTNAPVCIITCMARVSVILRIIDFGFCGLRSLPSPMLPVKNNKTNLKVERDGVGQVTVPLQSGEITHVEGMVAVSSSAPVGQCSSDAPVGQCSNVRR